MRHFLPSKKLSGLISALLLALAVMLPAKYASAQNASGPRTLSGAVKDKDGEPMAGAQIYLKGATRGVVSGKDGSYKIDIPAGRQMIVVTYVGYKQVEQEVAPSLTKLDITLEEDAMMLDDAIVVGYASQTKRSVTSAISSIKAGDISGYAGSSLTQSIAGLVPGLRISTVDATPDGDVDVQVRGIGSVTSGTQPLYIVDGIPVDGDLSSINPDDVDNIQVLKDAASTAIYGSRGANGVLLLTTKRGKEGKTQVSFNAGVTMSQAQRHFQVTNTAQLLDFLKDSNTNLRYQYTTNDSQDYFPFDPNLDTDWQDAIFRDAWSQKYNISVSGGGKDTRYRVSGEFFDQPGVVIFSGMRRYSFRANFDVKLGKKANMSVNFSPSATLSRKTREGGENGSNGVIRSAIAMYPFFPVTLPNGEYFSMIEYNRAPSDQALTAGRDAETGKFSSLTSNSLADNIENPVLIAEQYQNRSRTNKVSGGINFDFELLPGLLFKPSLSFQTSAASQNEWYPESIGKNRIDSYASSVSKRSLMWQNENIVTYGRQLGYHDLSLVGGFTVSQTTTEYLSATAYKFASTALPNINGGTINGGKYDYLDDRMVSFLARAGYSYRDKYLLTAIFRADGSSRFGSNYPYGYFPSVSAGWVVSEEKFMSRQKLVSELKLRTSWGVAGNNSIGQFNFVNRLTQSNYIFDGKFTQGWAPENVANPNLRWERSNQFNVGLDLGFIGNRIFLQADYYHTTTTDMLLNTIVPSTMGVSRMLQNAGSMLNRGLEFNVVSRNMTRRFKWTTNFNISFNRNEVTSLSVDAEAIYDGEGESNITKKGYPVGMFYGRLVQGIYQSMDEINRLRNERYSGLGFDPNTRPGDLKWMDLNGNGEMDDDDRTIIGNPHPIFYAGMTNTFGYGNFSLSVQLYGQYGNDIYNYSLHQLLRGTDNGNKSIMVVDRWRSESQPGKGIVDRITTTKDVAPAADKNKFSNRLLEDGSYLSIRNIQLSYSPNKKLLRKSTISGFTVYVSVDNLYTFTKYTGLNPESNSMKRVTAPGIDMIGYPISRNYTLGVKLTF